MLLVGFSNSCSGYCFHPLYVLATGSILTPEANSLFNLTESVWSFSLKISVGMSLVTPPAPPPTPHHTTHPLGTCSAAGLGLYLTRRRTRSRSQVPGRHGGSSLSALIRTLNYPHWAQFIIYLLHRTCLTSVARNDLGRLAKSTGTSCLGVPKFTPYPSALICTR